MTMAQSLHPGRAADPSSEVELTLSCRHLRNMDVFSKSDPMVVVSLFDPITNQAQQLGRTEVIKDNLNPDFAKKFVVQYHFEQRQELQFSVYDIDTPNLHILGEHDFIGSCIASLGQIVSSGREALDLCCQRKVTGQLIISAEELTPNLDDVSFQIRAQGLPCKWWSWLKVYLEVHKVDEQSDHTLVYRSETVPHHKQSSEPVWKPISLPVRCLCGGDDDRTVRIRCLSDRGMREPKLFGEAFVTLREIRDDGKNMLELVNRKKNTSVGKLRFTDFHISRNYSFLEYIMGGMQINCTIAIDFTASNGDPSIETSLHYISNKNPNQYEQALRAVVDILQDYDSDKLFPVLGFGAKIPPHGQVSHEFFVNMHHDNPFCTGVEGVMDAYKSCIRKVQLFGPTNFSPVIHHVTKFASAYQDGSQYFILLIITDGIITDMHRTKEAIISASTLPISIIIIGVGEADFDAMDELDGDLNPVTVNGRIAARDIVQFVAFRDFLKLRNKSDAKIYLAREVLAEIPAQVVGFMKSRGFAPLLRTPSEGEGERKPPPPYSAR